MRKSSFAFAVSLFLFLGLADRASAQCSVNENGQHIISTPGQMLCRTEATRIRYEVIEVGLCPSLPTINTSTNNTAQTCQQVINSPGQVDFSSGSNFEVRNLQRPDTGEYRFAYYRISPLAEFQGGFEFASEATGGTIDGESGSSTGNFCTAPDYEFNLDHIYTSGSNASFCSPTQSEEKLAAVNVVNFFSNSFQPVMSVPDSQIGTVVFANDADADQNAYLLNSSAKLAASRADVNSMVLILRQENPVVISPERSSLILDINLSDAINAIVTNSGGATTVHQIYLNGRTLSFSSE